MVGLLVQELRYPGQRWRWYLSIGLLVKMCGAAMYCAIYTLYYAGGDTTLYYDFGQIINQTMMYDPQLGWQILTAPANERNLATWEIVRPMSSYYMFESTYIVIRIGAVLGWLSFNSFWVISILFGAISFTGLWALYRVLIDLYPHLYRAFAWIVFFVPSVVFWGAGLLKDTITMGCLGWLCYAWYHLFIKRDQFFFPIVLLFITLFLISNVKVYIAAAFLPASIYWIYGHYKKYLSRPLFVALWGVALGILAPVFYLFQGKIMNTINSGIASFIQRAMDFQSWHSFLAERGQSGYTLGEMNFTLGGLLSKFPQAVNVTLFRPYLFEVRNPVMLITAVESLGFLLFTIYVLIRVGPFRSIRISFSYPFIIFCLIFALIFAFAVGLTSYNFGALARYKIPCLPFYLVAILLILDYHKKEKRRLTTN